MVSETIDVARDIARKLLESYLENGDPLPFGLIKVAEMADVDVAIGI